MVVTGVGVVRHVLDRRGFHRERAPRRRSRRPGIRLVAPGEHPFRAVSGDAAGAGAVAVSGDVGHVRLDHSSSFGLVWLSLTVRVAGCARLVAHGVPVEPPAVWRRLISGQ